jgi:RHS repeat-associated protein
MDGSYNPLPLNSWGTPHSAVGSPWLFTGRQLDEETGLYYFRARHYDSLKGRFLQRDSIDDLDGMNLYEFLKGNPLNATDPSGQTVLKKTDVDNPSAYWIPQLLKENAELLAKAKELLAAVDPNTKDEELQQLRKELEKKLKEYQDTANCAKDIEELLKSPEKKKWLKVEEYYINGEDQAAQFATEAGKFKTFSINIYFGHGTGSKDDPNKVSSKSLEAVQKALGKEDAERTSIYGFYSCFAGTYNKAVHKSNRFKPDEGQMTTEGQAQTGEIYRTFHRTFEGLMKRAEEMHNAWGATVTIRLYYGED